MNQSITTTTVIPQISLLLLYLVPPYTHGHTTVLYTLYIIVPPAPAPPASPLRLLGIEHMLQVAGEGLGEDFVGIERVRPTVLPV